MFETYTLNKSFSTANSNYNMGVPETSALWEPLSKQSGCRSTFEGYIKKSKNVTSISKEPSMRFVYPYYDDIAYADNFFCTGGIAQMMGIVGEMRGLCEDNPACTVETGLPREIPLAEVFINKTKAKLTEPLLLNILFEKQNYIVSHDDLGLLAVSDTLDKAIREIQEEFSLLWKDYVTCPEDELTEGAKRFRVKLVGLIE